MILGDLIKIEDGNPTFLDNPNYNPKSAGYITKTLINWRKQEMLYDQIEIIRKSQQIPYNYKKVPKIFIYLVQLKGMMSKDELENL